MNQSNKDTEDILNAIKTMTSNDHFAKTVQQHAKHVQKQKKMPAAPPTVDFRLVKRKKVPELGKS